jgi:phosphate transport system substrate-binding protein
MSGKQEKPLAALAIMLALATTSAPIAVNSTARPLLAQSSSSTSFPMPKELPRGKSLRIAGSTSMIKINQALEKNFKTKYPGTDIKFSYQGTNAALKALRQGKIDLAAIGRPLTKEEKAQGLVAVPVTRNKIAIIVGRNNRFNKSITAQQFARIYRGEISNWSQVGGNPGKIRVVDRPETSDTRQAFFTYSIFQNNRSKISPNKKKVAKDSTEAVISNLGNNGIGYAISDQVVNNRRVRVVPMHNALPNSVRYPFSQPLSYVYRKSNLTPAVMAFLGNATSSQNQKLVEASRVSGAMAAIDGSTTAKPPAVKPSASSPPAAKAKPKPAAGAVATDESKGGISPWLWLLLLPLFGGLVWWLFKGRGGRGAAPVVPPVVPAKTPESRITLTPGRSQDAYAHWQVPDRVKEEMRRQGGQKMKLRLYDVTHIDMDRQPPHSVKEFDCSEQQQDLQMPIALPERDYIVELGYLTNDNRWLSVIRSLHARIPAAVPTDSSTPATTPVGADVAEVNQLSEAVDEGRLILVPQSSQDAIACWEITAERKAALQKLGGKKLALRVYDTTGGIDLDRQTANSMWQYGCDEQSSNLHILISQCDRDYTAEIGYITEDGQWLKIARSSPVRINSEVKDSEIPTVATGALGVAAAAAETPIQKENRLIIVPKNAQEAYACWEISPEKQAEIQQLGGKKLVLCLYDITGDIDLDLQPAHSEWQHDCNEDPNLQIPIAQSDRDYIAEIGYITDYGQWLKIARSSPVRINNEAQDTGISPAALSALAGTIVEKETSETPVQKESRLTLLTRNSQEAYATWEITREKQAQLQELGGKKLVLYLYDITEDIDLDLQPAHSEWQYDCDEQSPNLQIPIAQSDRDYIAEIGYITDYGQWLKIARSSPVRINSEVKDSEIPVATGLAGTIVEQPTSETPVQKENWLILVPRNSQDAYACWKIPPEKQAELPTLGEKKLVLRLYDTTGGIDLDRQQAHCVRDYECNEQNTDLHIALPQIDRDYVAELGYITDDGRWLKIARSSLVQIKSEVKDSEIPATGTSIAGATPVVYKPTPTTTETLLWLIVRDLKSADVYWEISAAQKAELQTVGKTLRLRVYDITGIDFNKQPANSLQEYECDPNSTNLRVVIPVSDRDYIAELGYITNDGEWLKFARSASLRIVSPPKEVSVESIDAKITPPKAPSGFIGNVAQVISEGVNNVAKVITNVVADTSKTTTNLNGNALTVDATVNGSKAAVAKLGTAATNNTGTNGKAASKSECRIILVPFNAKDAYAYWEVSEDYKIALRQQGGKTFMLRVHDATDLDIDRQQPHNTQEYLCEETQQDRHVSVPAPDRDYIAEVGYYTDDGRWLRLIRSFHVRIPLEGKSKWVSV